MQNECVGFVYVQIYFLYLDARQGHCYTLVTRTGQCKNRLPIRLSKKDCCCGMNMGKGWGDSCDICPTPNTGKIKAQEFRSLPKDWKSAHYTYKILCSLILLSELRSIFFILFTRH